MSMKATPSDKLHWLFRLNDIDQNHEIDEDEMTEVFERLYKVALGAEAAKEEPQKLPDPKPNNADDKKVQFDNYT